MNIILNNVKFYYSDPYVPVFDNISLTIDTKWKAGLVGRNGAGKTTLLKLITGELMPVCGSIHVPVSIRRFPYQIVDESMKVKNIIMDSIAPFNKWERKMEELAKKGDKSSLEEYGNLLELYEQYDGYGIESRIEKELFMLYLDVSILNKKFCNLSGGEQTKIKILSLFLVEEEYPLIDEPTNHIDMQGRQLIAKYLAEKEGFLLVSHDRYFLDLCTDHIISINKSDIKINKGNYSQWKYNMDLEIEFEKRKDTNLKRKIKSLGRSTDRLKRWSFRIEKTKIGAGDKGAVGASAARMMKRAKNVERRIKRNIEEKSKLLKNKEKSRSLKLKTEFVTREILVSVSNLYIAYDQNVIIKDFSLILRRGDRIAITGRNGTGKTTLIKAILGYIKPQKGIIYKPSFVRFMSMRQVPKWNEKYLKDIIESRDVDLSQFRNVLASMGIKGDIFERPISTFSMGERKKVEMAFSFTEPASVYVWDEPLNYVDVFSREQIEEVILKYKPTMLFIEHDRYFIEKVATDVVDLDKYTQ